MAFDAFEVALSVIPLLPLDAIRLRDPDLVKQIRRAAASIPQNIAEGRERVGGDRLHLWRVAYGSAAEVVASLRIAVAFGYVKPERVAPALAELDRVRAMLWVLTH